MRYLNYQETLEICKNKTDELVKKKQLKAFCEENEIDYHSVAVYVRGGYFKKKIYPKLLKKLLEAFGYKIKVDKKVQYNFIIEEES